jgi:hypothetical protein
VAARYCPHCGAPNPTTATFCQYCGTVLPALASTPLPSGAAGAPPPPPSPWGAPAYGTAPYPAPAPPPPRRRAIVWILVGFVVLILVIGVISFLAVPPSPPVNVVVTMIYFDSPDNACGLAGATDYGFNASTNQTVPFTYQISGANNSTGTGTLACTITDITTSTPGFSVTGATVPLMIAADATQLLSFNLSTPSDPYTGVLTFVIT